MESHRFDLIVVGAGLSGLTAAAAAAARGLRVGLTNTGFGLFVFGAGCVEAAAGPVEHPDASREAIDFFCSFSREADYPFQGGAGERRHLPTMMGSFQTVSLAPGHLWNGAAEGGARAVVVGIKGLSSFEARFTAERLAFHAARHGFLATYAAREIALPSEPGTCPTTLQFANRFDRDADFRAELAEILRPLGGDADLIILPGILGQRTSSRDISEFERSVGCPVCELPTLPPSVPGLRLFHALGARLKRTGVEMFSGYPVNRLDMEGRRCAGVVIDRPARPLRLTADTVVLASGRFSGPLLGRPFTGIDAWLRPVSGDGAVIADNLHAAGALLQGVGGHGGNGQAILTGYRTGLMAARQGGRDAAE